MSFAEQRQKALAGGALSSRFFAEDVEITPLSGSPVTATVKISHEQLGPTSGQRGVQQPRGGTVEEMERIHVLVNRNTAAAGHVQYKPNPGDGLLRAAARDADQRPFGFAGEVVYEGDQHAVYVFQRRRRVTQGRP